MDESSPSIENSRRLWVTVSWVLVGTLVGQLASVGVLLIAGYSLSDGIPDLAALPGHVLAGMVAVVQLLGYLVPGLISATTLFGKLWPRAVQLLPSPSLRQLALGVVAFALCMPMTAALAELNLSIELSGWQLDIEDNVTQTLTAIIQNGSIGGLLVAIVIVAVLPALGEELVFRGLIQPGLIKATGSGHVGVWLTALAFGLVHLQFAGLLPRVFLGAVLGFLAYYSQRLWVPVLAHFLFNGAQVIALRMGALDQAEELDKNLDIDSLWTTLLGIAGVVLASFLLPRLRPGTEQPELPDELSSE